MADSSIQWTDKTWNAVAGCSLESPGCTHCYAMRMARRLELMGQEKYAGLTKTVNGRPVWNGAIRVHRPSLRLPLDWKKPRNIFVNSMSDLFHEDLPDEEIDAHFAVMAIADHHRYQVLTKRQDRLLEYLSEPMRLEHIYDHWYGYANYAPCAKAWPLPNVHIGLSIEDQKRADLRGPVAVELAKMGWFTWFSIEPLLEPVDIRRYLPRRAGGPGVGWVVIGGESGPGARVFGLDLARSLLEQCRERGIPVFVKQLGARPFEGTTPRVRLHYEDRAGGDIAEWPQDLRAQDLPA